MLLHYVIFSITSPTVIICFVLLPTSPTPEYIPFYIGMCFLPPRAWLSKSLQLIGVIRASVDAKFNNSGAGPQASVNAILAASRQNPGYSVIHIFSLVIYILLLHCVGFLRE